MAEWFGLLRRDRGRATQAALYAAVVAAARQPGWYLDGGVADTIDGRFDMVTTLLALVMIRLEDEGAAGRAPAALLAERFIDDMDGQIRELGIGDIVVGKHVGKMMGALGGRIGAYREGLGPEGDIAGALVRNLYRGAAPADAVPAYAVARVRGFVAALAATPLDALLAGGLPAA